MKKKFILTLILSILSLSKLFAARTITVFNATNEPVQANGEPIKVHVDIRHAFDAKFDVELGWKHERGIGEKKKINKIEVTGKNTKKKAILPNPISDNVIVQKDENGNFKFSYGRR